MIKVATIPEAWELAYKLADAGEYELDKDSEERAGYEAMIAAAKLWRTPWTPIARACTFEKLGEVET